MDDPVRSALLAILKHGLLRIRAFASVGDAKQCFIWSFVDSFLHKIPKAKIVP